ncbi:GntP family permease [Massilia agri]|uniref:GntP family permease n=1 Tax=Massilia agri TaxID=1886785 RepID=A0ABT2AFJ4_9BURK|nr:GntP family permease [Massilia agri]MCS0594961.1 GntP family permease [Massilia agri]
MEVLVVLSALALLMLAAYRGYSVILFAPVCAMLGVLVTDPASVPAMFSGVFMEKLVAFVKLYFPVFVLGAVFGKLIELSGFSQAIVKAVIQAVGRQRAILSIVLVCAVLTYGGVSLFVVVFAVYPFAAEMFRQGDIPKRLIPATIALGAFTFTMAAMPGSPQIQNIIPTTFFATSTWAAPFLGLAGSVFIVAVGVLYLESRRRQAARKGEGYGEGHRNEPETFPDLSLPHPLLAISPLVVVGVLNALFTHLIPLYFGSTVTLEPGGQPLVVEVTPMVAIWAVEGALLAGIAWILLFAFRSVASRFAEGSSSAVAGALLASLNTASEYGFGAVIAALPGFSSITAALERVPNPLINEAVSVSVLAGITGSASGGMSIALAALSDTFIAAAREAHIPMEVLHRVASMASGGMDTLPHNGAVITLLAVTGLTHRQSYRDIFMVTVLVATSAVLLVIALYYMFGIV